MSNANKIFSIPPPLGQRTVLDIDSNECGRKYQHSLFFQKCIWPCHYYTESCYKVSMWGANSELMKYHLPQD